MKKNILAFCIAALFTAAGVNGSAYAGEAELLQRLDKLGNEIEALKAELKRIKDEKDQEKATQLASRTIVDATRLPDILFHHTSSVSAPMTSPCQDHFGICKPAGTSSAEPW